ncbi:MAG: anti-sigma factor family protein, partial [Vicinamibacteraceae bacterium]
MNAFSCADVGERLSAFRDGEMPIDEQRAVRAHLSSCPTCAEHATALDSVGVFLRASVRRRTSEQQDDLSNLPMRVVSQ